MESEKERLNRQLEELRHNKGHLEAQAAQFGPLYVPSYIPTQIENLQKNIEKVEQQLKNVAQQDELRPLSQSQKKIPKFKFLGRYSCVTVVSTAIAALFLLFPRTNPSAPTTTATLFPQTNSPAVIINNTTPPSTVLKETILTPSPSAIASTSVLTTLPPTPTTVSQVFPSQSSSSITINQVYQSIQSQDFTVIIDRIEFSKDKMRWYLTFSNKTNNSATMAFIPERLYLVDNLGRKYLMQQQANQGNLTLLSNQPQSNWIEFQIPTKGAKNFTVNFDFSYFSFPKFDLGFTAPDIYAIPQTTPTAIPGATSIQINKTFETSQLRVKIDRIEFARDKMRWLLIFSNKTNQSITVTFDPKRIYLVDNLGKRYLMKQQGTQGNIDLVADQIQANWIDFQVPFEGANNFTVNFDFYYLSIPKFDLTFIAPITIPQTTPTVIPGATSIQINKIFETSQLRVKIDRIEFARDKMRWLLIFSNKTNQSITVTFDSNRIYLLDGKGNKYSMLQQGTQGDIGLVAGQVQDNWIEFQVPFEGANNFTVNFDFYDLSIPKFSISF